MFSSLVSWTGFHVAVEVEWLGVGDGVAVGVLRVDRWIMIQWSILPQLQASNQTVEESSSSSMSNVVECIRTIASVYQLGCLGQQRPMPSSDFSTATSPALEGEPRAHLKSRGIRAQQISGRCTWPASCAVSFAPPTIEQQPGLSFQPNSNVTLHLPQSSLLLPLQPHPNSIDPSLFTRLYTTPSHQSIKMAFQDKAQHQISQIDKEVRAHANILPRLFCCNGHTP